MDSSGTVGSYKEFRKNLNIYCAQNVVCIVQQKQIFTTPYIELIFTGCLGLATTIQSGTLLKCFLK